jgi:hypothetical protein
MVPRTRHAKRTAWRAKDRHEPQGVPVFLRNSPEMKSFCIGNDKSKIAARLEAYYAEYIFCPE